MWPKLLHCIAEHYLRFNFALVPIKRKAKNTLTTPPDSDFWFNSPFNFTLKTFKNAKKQLHFTVAA